MATLPTTIEYFDNLLGEQLTEGGGGGDFSTATVTISDVNKMGWCFAAPLIAIEPSRDFPEAFPYIEHTFFSDTTDARTIVLYKGVAIIDIVSDEGGTLSVAGNAVLGNGSIKVTGDCTITIS